jgi:hypothetical protein
MPGTDISLVEQASSRSIPTDTGVAFFVGAGGPAASGVAGPVKLVNIDQFTGVYGARTAANSTLYDSIEAYFREGGAEVYVSATSAAAPVEADYETALGLFNKELGPGQVLAPGVEGIHSVLLAHAEANHRVALLDGPNNADPAAVQAAEDALDADPNRRFGAFFGNWLVIGGLTAGTTRTIPPSPVVAGLIARSDRANNPNVPAAGSNGVSRTAVDLAEAFTTAQADALNDGSVNVFRNVFGNIELYGWRSVVKKVDDPQ